MMIEQRLMTVTELPYVLDACLTKKVLVSMPEASGLV